ncbi:MAG: VOC family protein [Anaerolineaceae bacterium]|nr:VOC family protein [Anaerolineaceae bacterium]
MEVIPNIHFNNGECEPAIRLYQKAFNAQLKILLRYRDADPRDMSGGPGSDRQNTIYHSELIIGTQRIFLNDNDETQSGDNNVSVLVSFADLEAFKFAYETLKDGARIRVPWQETTYSQGFASLIDRYGVRWELIKEI